MHQEKQPKDIDYKLRHSLLSSEWTEHGKTQVFTWTVAPKRTTKMYKEVASNRKTELANATNFRDKKSKSKNSFRMSRFTCKMEQIPINETKLQRHNSTTHIQPKQIFSAAFCTLYNCLSKIEQIQIAPVWLWSPEQEFYSRGCAS